MSKEALAFWVGVTGLGTFFVLRALDERRSARRQPTRVGGSTRTKALRESGPVRKGSSVKGSSVPTSRRVAPGVYELDYDEFAYRRPPPPFSKRKAG